MATPTVTTQAVDDIAPRTATGNGNITAIGAGYCKKRGFVFSLTTHNDPGNTAPELSDYEFFIQQKASYSNGAYELEFSGLLPDTKYYVRAYAYNIDGYAYGNEVNFNTLLRIYPDLIYTPRAKANKTDVIYDTEQPNTLYAEDIIKLDDEVVNIETELGANPKGVYASVAAYLAALLSAVGTIVTTFLGLTDTPANYTGSGGKVVAVKADLSGLEFITAGGAAKCTGAEINTGTEDAKFATPKAIADSDLAFLSDIPTLPTKATGAEINTGTNDTKFATPKAIADSDIAFLADLPNLAAHAALLSAHAITIVVKTANETVNNSIVYQNDDHLFLTLAINSAYFIEFYLIWDLKADSDIKFKFTYPANVTGYQFSESDGPQALYADISAENPVTNIIKIDTVYRHKAIILVGATAGTFQLQWAQNTAKPDDTITLKGSLLRATKLY